MGIRREEKKSERAKNRAKGVVKRERQQEGAKRERRNEWLQKSSFKAGRHESNRQ